MTKVDRNIASSETMRVRVGQGRFSNTGQGRPRVRRGPGGERGRFVLHLGGLWDQRGLVETRDPAQGGDDPGVEAAARAARIATVLPAPTSPVTTPRARSLMH